MICPKCGCALEMMQASVPSGEVDVVFVYCSNEDCDYETEITPAPNPKPAQAH